MLFRSDTARLSQEPATSSTHFHPIAGLLDLLTILHLGSIPRARVSPFMCEVYETCPGALSHMEALLNS